MEAPLFHGDVVSEGTVTKCQYVMKSGMKCVRVRLCVVMYATSPSVSIFVQDTHTFLYYV